MIFKSAQEGTGMDFDLKLKDAFFEILRRETMGFDAGGSARSVEDETRSSDWNANRNPKQNHETTVLWLFSNFQVKRDLVQ